MAPAILRGAAPSQYDLARAAGFAGNEVEYQNFIAPKLWLPQISVFEGGSSSDVRVRVDDWIFTAGGGKPATSVYLTNESSLATEYASAPDYNIGPP